jgi:hypothetical protein
MTKNYVLINNHEKLHVKNKVKESETEWFAFRIGRLKVKKGKVFLV